MENSQWKETILGNISRVRRGASPRPIDSPEWFADKGYGWIRISDVTKSNGKLYTTEQYLSNKGVLKSVHVAPGQLIMSICATIGEPVVVQIDACIHDGFVVFDNYENNLSTQYLFHFLRYYTPVFKSQGQTGTQANINTSIVNSTKLLLPPLSEQCRIAEILDMLDEAILETERLIAKLRDIKTGLLHDLLTRGLDSDGTLRNAEAHPEQFKDSPLGRIPREWEVSPFTTIAIAIDPQPDHRAPAEVKDGEPYVGIGDFRLDGTIDFDNCRKVSSNAINKQKQRFNIEEGDILFGKIGTIGQPKQLINSRPYALNANTILIKPKVDSSFVFWILKSIYVENVIKTELHSTSQPAFGIQKVRMIQVPVPSTSEQSAIANVLDTHAKRIQEEEAYRDKLKAMKKGLMEDLLTGKVRVEGE